MRPLVLTHTGRHVSGTSAGGRPTYRFLVHPFLRLVELVERVAALARESRVNARQKNVVDAIEIRLTTLLEADDPATGCRFSRARRRRRRHSLAMQIIGVRMALFAQILDVFVQIFDRWPESVKIVNDRANL